MDWVYDTAQMVFTAPEAITPGIEIFIPPAVEVQDRVLVLVDLVSEDLR